MLLGLVLLASIRRLDMEPRDPVVELPRKLVE
jgi:hypothetical protein